MTETESDCTVLVCSCDRYADLLAPFAELFEKFWPDCPWPLVLVTETDPKIARFDRTIACGEGLNWASRLERALGEIATPHVLMLCDDYFLSGRVDTENLIRRLGDMKRLDAVNLRLIPNPPRGVECEGGLMRYPKNTAYCVATQAGFWKREFLARLARGKSSIWEFERYGSFEVGDEPRAILATRTKEFPFVDAVHKGHWERFGASVCRENNIDVDFGARGFPSFGTRLIEGAKAAVFALLPATAIVRVQNLLGVGARERKQAAVRGAS